MSTSSEIDIVAVTKASAAIKKPRKTKKAHEQIQIQEQEQEQEQEQVKEELQCLQEEEKNDQQQVEVVEPVIEELNCYIEKQVNTTGSTRKNSTVTGKKKRIVNAEMSFGNCLEGKNDHSFNMNHSTSFKQNNIILHLKISEDYDNKNDEIVPDDMINHQQVFSYNPDLSVPTPYDSQHCFHSQPQFIESSSSTGGINSNEEQCEMNEIKEDTHEKKSSGCGGGSSCKLSCWWCCHEILGGSDFRLPIRKYNLKFQSTGRFCSPECLVAYNFESGHRYGDVHRQYMWINYIYIGRRVDGTTVPIQSAPPRETLKIFGGNYTIEEFRSRSLNYNVTINASLQPLVPINGFTDEIVVEYKRSKAFVPLEKERVERATSELKLKRKKMKKGEKTLDDFMNLKSKSKN
jgi:hypothetical protein